MLRRVTRFLFVGVAALLVAVLAVGGTAVPALAQDPPAPGPTDTAVPVPPPLASIVVDVETGAVVTESNSRQALPPASTTKIITALLARQNLDFEGEIGISATATMAPPRRLALTYGTTWGVRDLLNAMLLCSCNDAAWALGQAAGGGTMPGYHDQAQALADHLGLADGPVLYDPAGLDDERSVEGGNLLSARDLAIAARAFLADPELAAIAVTPEYEWTGGDGAPHSVTNLDAFLGAYPGAIGLKTGYTSRAGMTFVGAAERDGRTLVAVVLGSEAHYAHARELLDAGFMLASIEDTTGDVLPPVPDDLVGATPPTTESTTTTSTAPDAASSASDPGPGPTTVVGDEVAAAPLRSTGGDDDLPVEPQWIILGLGGVTLVLVIALLARWRMTRDRIDRTPAKPRRRDRR